MINHHSSYRQSTSLAADVQKAVKDVTGAELEMLMQEWDSPLVVDAYATWCGPCMQMAPEYEEAAKELEGRVRFCKLDTDKEENMAARLQIEGLPTILFLDAHTPEGADEDAPKMAALKGRIEGGLPKDLIVGLCEFYFFDGPMPEGFA